MAVVIGCFCLIVIAINIHLQAYTLAVVEGFLLLTCIFIYRKAKKNLLSGWSLFILPYFFLLVVIYGTYIKELSEGLFLWSYIIPTLFYLLYGRSHGFIIATIVAIVQTASIFIKEDTPLYNTTVISINFILAYISIWVVSHIYESKRDQAQKELKELALRDPLTKAYNRLALIYFFDKKLQEKTELSIIVIDLDFFKQINDNYGHDAGDLTLKECVKSLRIFLGDEQIYRIGGEEFALLIPSKRELAFELINKIRLHIEQHKIQYKEHTIKFTFSAGVIECLKSNSLSDSLKEADLRLYKAKNNGRNQIQ